MARSSELFAVSSGGGNWSLVEIFFVVDILDHGGAWRGISVAPPRGIGLNPYANVQQELPWYISSSLAVTLASHGGVWELTSSRLWWSVRGNVQGRARRWVAVLAPMGGGLVARWWGRVDCGARC
ncbi:hypothetical protein GOP47_0021438 [Adiantum capillus-veneris]|uniref:Uncharacterized protein n=1 Tax=Adiantum capillus-veneris TaxID=13818 RepID=A0A9D4Z7V2_ADICA|nr:hypothetical protein GOP47_0021438 [Adiantum capillus-veneris]